VIARRQYPGNYDRTTWEARQSDDAAQAMSVNDPYDNTYQADIADLGMDQLAQDQAAADAATAAGGGGTGDSPPPGAGTCGGAYVRYTWDSQPIASRDAWSDGQPNQFGGQNNQSGPLTIPQGMIGIVRTIIFSPGAATGPLIDQRGLSLQNYLITIKQNGIPVPGFTLIDVTAGFPSGGEIECFIMCQPGDVITGAAFFNGTEIDDSTINQLAVGFKFWAQLLPNDGRNLPEQAGNALSEPVCIDGASIAQLKPPPLVIPTPGGPVIVSQQAAAAAAGPLCAKPPLVSVNDYLACIASGGSPAP
jgi:hypothetical protein